ncbi:COPA [Lepeophtheirus salmonis]|uniref:COPA n=1 Tax=Lepeophtheirus salmonis TaxID=72036 RepID=A0A7R8H2V2_LEPSM|nr:COPA [Lepeophtheirus salmonis]CAF2835691.1 COPA [Lepeophtheirus salmonis]
MDILKVTGETVVSKSGLPAVGVKMTDLVSRLQTCYQFTTSGKFGDAVDKLRSIVYTIPLLVVETKPDEAEAQEMRTIVSNYLVGLIMESMRKELPKGSLEEQKTSLILKTSGSFARRLLELGPKPEVASQTRKILQACDKNPVDEHKVEYDEFNPFDICGRSFTPIYRGQAKEDCPFCLAKFKPEFKNELCNICNAGQIGKSVQGLKIRRKIR